MCPQHKAAVSASPSRDASPGSNSQTVMMAEGAFQITVPKAPETFAAAFGAWLIYLAYLAIYRLYVSPLAGFPGPKLAALTRWYEAYYEIVLLGQFSRKIDELHDTYGPIIRVAPDEIHIRDSSFFEKAYGQNTRLDKPGWENKFGMKDVTFTTLEHTLHRERRGALSQMFSRRMALNFEPVIRQCVERLCERISEFVESSQPLVISDVYPCLSGDVVMQYALGFGYNQLDSPKFDSFHGAFQSMGASGHVTSQFPWFLPLINALPDRWIERMQPALANLLKLKKDLLDLTGRIVRGEEPLEKNLSRPTIFQQILQSDLPPQEKSHYRLAGEAQSVMGGGIESPAHALTVATFHIANTPHISQRLRSELVKAFPDINVSPTLLELEKLPYLKACIQESLRLSYGLSARNPRSQDQHLQYGKWTIPARTTVAMTIVDVHHDGKIFPDSHSFIPERWLDDPLAPDGTPLERYLVAFGRGSRSCLGINLAWAELYCTMGLVFRQFDFKLYETDVSDVKLQHDFFVPRAKLDSKGVRVFVSKTKVS
ncbi:uncharacterized protein PADG_07991 [Paracoccidioides brasiliensis Pb18]|uniref:Trichodiene oxygenase n=1 Tax=Paracoccidioides brasiliensis (strain Pb18) TaxID=502780 RepID=C1GKY4_PARBD|nr:uncharacterized protein PADG_07991 [Paracoccidioides brasiliensis Pb18]EEH43171.2 hypothetical protein PADG_07991 [Paracoccidioides brasiliensis Pb18]